MESLSAAFEAFSLVFLAEFGDKSQLVVMTLAAQYRHWPIIVGAVSAFSILNLLAVVFGAALALWLPGWLVALVVALLFLFFGVQSLFFEEDEDEDAPVKMGRQLIFSVFALIFFAEFGDKTQLAVAALGGMDNAVMVWVGATIALAATTVLGVEIGRKLLQKLPLVWIHRTSGVLFVILGLVALFESYQMFRLLPA